MDSFSLFLSLSKVSIGHRYLQVVLKASSVWTDQMNVAIYEDFFLLRCSRRSYK